MFLYPRQCPFVLREAMPTLSALSRRCNLMHLSLSIPGLFEAGFASAVQSRAPCLCHSFLRAHKGSVMVSSLS